MLHSTTFVLALTAQHVAGLAMPSPGTASGPVMSSAAAAPLGRRQAIATAFGAVTALCAERANAYDAIPQVEPDFAAMEKLRAERVNKSVKKTAELREKLQILKATKDAKSFIAAADDMALWVIGEGSGARGSPVACTRGGMLTAGAA